jgi:hypothetical protein
MDKTFLSTTRLATSLTPIKHLDKGQGGALPLQVYPVHIVLLRREQFTRCLG